MKRIFKQWWSTIPPISTKPTVTCHFNWSPWTPRRFKQWWSSISLLSTKRVITSHLNWTLWTQTSLNSNGIQINQYQQREQSLQWAQKRRRVRVLEIQVLSCNRHKYEEILGFHPSPLDKWIFNGNINTTCYQQNEWQHKH